MNIHLDISPLKHRVKDYETVILCGPIWMGKFIPPLRSFIKRYGRGINRLIFVTCCGSPFAKMDEKFGHGLVFKEVENLLKEKCLFCQAFPVGLVLPDDKKEAPDTFMKTHLNDESFIDGLMRKTKDAILTE